MKRFALLIAFVANVAAFAEGERVLVLVLDGLRPDYVTESLMPNLYALGQRGVVFEDHHSVYPTVTRVNSPSIATGSYPDTHGLIGNAIYIPEVDPDRALDTSDQTKLKQIDEATNGNLLTTQSLGEVLDAAGKKILAVSSGSSGSAFLLNHKVKGGGVIHTGLILPESQRAHVLDVLGPVPPQATPSGPRNAWAVDAYIKIGLDEVKPDLTLMWLTDPDHTAHEKGMGAPETVEALRLVDLELARVLAAHADRGLTETVQIMVTSDHGFSTHIGGTNVAALLTELGIDAVVAGGAIHLKEKSDATLKLLVSTLQRTDWVGSIFTRPSAAGAIEGVVPGTLSFDVIHWNHPRAADVVVTADWSGDEAVAGFRGTTRQNGVAGHGTDSYYDVHNSLIASGSMFKQGVSSSVPTANVDIAPTVCKILGLTVPTSMQGRVISEALQGGPNPTDIEVRSQYDVVEAPGYRLALSRSQIGDRVYFNWTRVERRPVAP